MVPGFESAQRRPRPLATPTPTGGAAITTSGTAPSMADINAQWAASQADETRYQDQLRLAQQSLHQRAPRPQAAPQVNISMPSQGPAVQALERAGDPTPAAAAGPEGWQAVATPSETRPGLGQRLPAQLPPLFRGHIY